MGAARAVVARGVGRIVGLDVQLPLEERWLTQPGAETLLAALDAAARERDAALAPARRRAEGVVHTPARVASAMVREADLALARAGLPRIGSASLEILDPATGPGVFLAAVIAHTRGEGARLVGLDIDPLASARTRQRIASAAAAHGYRVEMAVEDALASGHEPPPTRSLLVIGNPPWSARGRGPAYVEALVRDFHRDEHGAPLTERRRGVLADAYVRFVRWSADAVSRARRGGALALVTSSSYLDGPVHRGMRAFLLASFDEISITDLGGSALTARLPGAVDENVFGVRPGVAILVATRAPGARGAQAHVSFRAVSGTREDKLAALASLPDGAPVLEPLVSFRPRAPTEASYASWPPLPEWIPFHAEGVQTNRDELVVDVDRDALLERLAAIADGRVSLPARAHFDPRRARIALAELREREGLEPHVAPIAYRPFDPRFAFVHPVLCHRPRPLLLAAVRASRLSLVSVRKDRGALPWAHAAIVEAPIDNCYLSARSSCRARAFPSHRSDGAPNLSAQVGRSLDALGLAWTPDDVLAYLAAVLSAPTYARRFADALAVDYPRVPLPRDRESFVTLAALGRQLATIFAARVSPVRAAKGRELARVGHHAFDPAHPVIASLRALREQIDRVVIERGRELW